MFQNIFKKKKVNLPEFPDTLKIDVYVKNRLDIENYFKLLLYSIYGIKNVHVIVHEQQRLMDNLSSGDYIIDAVLHKSPIDHCYNLILNKTLHNDIKTILCHEAHHLKQYEDGDLLIDGDNVLWKKKKYQGDMEYSKRPWEKEAFKAQTNNLRQMRKLWK